MDDVSIVRELLAMAKELTSFIVSPERYISGFVDAINAPGNGIKGWEPSCVRQKNLANVTWKRKGENFFFEQQVVFDEDAPQAGVTTSLHTSSGRTLREPDWHFKPSGDIDRDLHNVEHTFSMALHKFERAMGRKT